VNTKEILRDIGARTKGDIYLGVVGPVRSGKSTFIKRFMEVGIIPSITDEYEKERSIDELPQSGGGKAIMTTEPKFVPSSAVKVALDNNIAVNVRLIDCVGYVFDEAKGYKDEDGERMVKTPWFEEPVPFSKAAKIGTQKVINEHSTIGVVVTCDGSILDFDRSCYEKPEKEVVEELIAIGKPFIIVVNSKAPTSDACNAISDNLRSKYNAPVIALNVDTLTIDDFAKILKEALYEFPLVQIDVALPSWVEVLNNDHWLKISINKSVEDAMKTAQKIRDAEKIGDVIKGNEYISKYELSSLDTSTGNVKVDLDVREGLYEDVMKEIAGFDLNDPSDLLRALQDYSNLKKEFSGLGEAIKMAKTTGYGFATPCLDDIRVDKPELVKQGGRYGVRIKAQAPSLHIVRVDVETSFEPIIGSKEQSEDLINLITEGFDQNPHVIFESSLFGRKLGDIVKDGVNAKLMVLPEPTRAKLQQIMKTLANKGKTNIIAIIF
jgi:stage IV sporulation protein A